MDVGDLGPPILVGEFAIDGPLDKESEVISGFKELFAVVSCGTYMKLEELFAILRLFITLYSICLGVKVNKWIISESGT